MTSGSREGIAGGGLKTRRCACAARSRCTGIAAASRLLPALIVLLLFPALSPVPAQADPDYEGPYLYGLDPVLRVTDDPRLLGVERLIRRQRMLELGIDPLKEPDARPGLYSSFRRAWQSRSNVDLVRREELIEYNGSLGVMTVFRYPSYFFLFPAQQKLSGGFVYYPPRPVADPAVDLFLDELDRGQERRRAVDRHVIWSRSLVRGGLGGAGGIDDGLINLTIPIKLPRTLEKIIGRGEKTRIKITGREHISIGGESTVVKPFTPNERISSQSYFPSLDMEQQLQVNLSGTIGEKIIIEVDHNSEAIGPDATKIKLMYRGLEDEIINTIEAGDVGLTLPGSQLLGYSGNKSGLFGVKVTGQVGRIDFTVVASKQKAETSSKTFNSSGGSMEDNVIYSYQYLNNRFFYPDLPGTDWPGRDYTQHRIDPNSIQVYVQEGAGASTTGITNNIAVYVDSTGVFSDSNGLLDFTQPYFYSERWRLLETEPLLDADGGLVAIDLRQQLPAESMLAVAYRTIDELGMAVDRVGDIPGADERGVTLEDGNDYYRMKLLKAPETDKQRYTFRYVLRNIYPLGGAHIDAETFQLRIERNEPGAAHPDQDETGVSYLRAFGLDRNDGRGGPPDGEADKTDPYLFDLEKGLLKFPLGFPQPFAADSTAYLANAPELVWGGSFLSERLTPAIYDPDVLSSFYDEHGTFKIIASHASAASSFSLGASNIEEGSEVVTLDGRKLQRDVDYDIDYTFGQITLKGDASILTPDSKVAVNYQYAPFMGGGKTSLMGVNMGYDLGRESKLSTTLLYQTEAIVGEKAKLGEEPSKTLVGNVNMQHSFRPYFLTHVANFLSRRKTERESTLQFSGELAVSVPNPNTKGQVYLEDFEGVDASDIVSLTRTSWAWASAPLSEMDADTLVDGRVFDPEDRVETNRWFLPQNRVLRRYLNPGLENQERDETQQSMNLFLRSEDGNWGTEDWGGIMRGISRTGLDLSRSQFLEFWVNDAVADSTLRSGRLHIDFGYISEDGFWPTDDEGVLEIGTWQREDGILPLTEPDNVWIYDEDIGLDGNEWGDQRYEAGYEINGDAPFPGINGTARNNREDTEDLNGNTRLDKSNGYFSAIIPLRSEAEVDVLRDYANHADYDELYANNRAWRKYRIRISDMVKFSDGTDPNLEAITHVRIWVEGVDSSRRTIQLELAELRFLGSRWERNGIRSVGEETLLEVGDGGRGVYEEFFLGEVNNKDDPESLYPPPPFNVPVVNGIEEKEQSLQIDFRNLEPGHMLRAGKQVSPRGDDYLGYEELSWFWYNPDRYIENQDLDLFFRVGADTLNYYEVGFRFDERSSAAGWQYMKVNLAELSNTKNDPVDPETGHINSTIRDTNSGQTYNVRVVGRPDLRAVKRYYFGVANNRADPGALATGEFYLNDVKLEGVKRDRGLAQRAGVRLNMADVLKMDFDWSNRDAEFHGLDADRGTGIFYEDWNFSTSFNVDDFIPLLGFQLPVQLSRGQRIQRPKYETNSDIEILDDNVRRSLSTVNTQERFSTRLKHLPSKATLMRYLVDPWQVTVSGSRAENSSPLDRSQQKSLQGTLNYDLRIPGQYRLGAYPVLGLVPLVKAVSVVPSKVALGASFTSTYNASVAIDEYGVVTPRSTTKNRPGKLTASMDYRPLPIVNMSVSGTSDRDLLREGYKYGMNIGREGKRSYSLRMTFTPPKAKDLPTGKVMYPFRKAVRGLNKLRPSIQFTGGFADVFNDEIRQPGDPVGIHSMSNDGNWDLRFNMPVGEFVKSILPEKQYSGQQRQRLLDEQRRREQQDLRRRPPGTSADEQTPDTTGGKGEDADEPLTPEEMLRREEERLLEEAEARLEEERERGLGEPETAAESEAESEGRGIPNPLTPLLNTLRNTKDVKVTVTNRRSSAYGRTAEQAGFWYQAGLASDLEIADELVAVHSFQERKGLSLSTSSQITRAMALDVKFSKDEALTERLGAPSRNYRQEWPDAQLSLGGIEKWGLLGGDSQNPDAGWFRSSNISFSYKRSKTVNNMTSITYNPQVTTTINPRWSFSFHSGMTATLTSSLSQDRSMLNGTLTESDKTRYGLQLQHKFRAKGLLARLGLYKPGANPTITMDVDINYMKTQNQRTNLGATPAAPTGSQQYGVKPRFSYQISRNLTSALRLGYNRTKNIATNVTTTKISMGMEVTFVF